MFNQSEDHRELWTGKNKNLASNYVKKYPLGHRFIYEGRINGMPTNDRKALMELEIFIISKIYDLRAA